MSLRKEKNKDDFYIRRTIVLSLHDITSEQENYLNRAVELYRFVYNWTLDTRQAYYEEHKKEHNYYLTDNEIQKMLSDLRNKTEWLQEVPLGTLRNAMFDAFTAYELWFKGYNKRPKHKTKKRSKISYSPRADRTYLRDNMLKIEGVPGKINIGWHSKFVGTQEERDKLKYANVRVSKDTNGKWKITFSILMPRVVSKNYDNLYDTYTPSYDRAIGIDLNKKNLIVTSYMNGEIYKLPESIYEYLNKYKKLCKVVQRDIKLTKRRHPEISNLEDYDLSDYKSNNAKKRQIKAAKAKRKTADIINTYVHTISKRIIERYPVAIVMENIKVRDWYKYHSQASGIAYIPFYKIRRIFENKCDKYNVPFILADRTYPSTQRCSCCGHIQKDIGHKHTYRCPVCGMIKDRDINAAFNLEQLAYKDYIDPFIWMPV